MSSAPVAHVESKKPAGLVVFGILQILAGALSALMAALTVAGLLLTAGTDPAMGRMMIPGIAFYTAAAVWFITVGIGSLLPRRWAHALSLAAGWLWLATGVMTAIVMLFLFPVMLDSMPETSGTGMGLVMGGCLAVFVGGFMILAPLAIVLYYRRPLVRAAVGRLDPAPRWTDPIPIPLLVFILLWAYVAFSCVVSAFTYRAIPLGAAIVEGPAATAILLATAALAGWIAWGSTRRLPSAWWTALATLIAGAAFTIALLPSIDVAAWYEAMGVQMDPRQIWMIEDLYAKPWFLALSGILWAAYLGWLLWLRRFFQGSKPGAEGRLQSELS
jgi:hypothetical protein